MMSAPANDDWAQQERADDPVKFCCEFESAIQFFEIFEEFRKKVRLEKLSD